MAISLVQSIEASNFTGSSGSSISATYSSAVSASNLLVAVMWGDRSSAPSYSVADNQSQTWTAIGSATHFGGAYGQLFYMPNTVGASSFQVTGTLGSGTTFYALGIHEFSGCATTSPLDASNVTKTSTSTSGNATSNSITTTANGDLIFAAVTDDIGDYTFTTPSGWTGAIVDSGSGSQVTAYEVQGTAGSVSASWPKSGSGSIAYWAPIASFLAASTPVVNSNFFFLM